MGYGTPLPYNPAVAVPTDTTQLGYYYNQVPTWQPKPNMIPGIPNPDSWHIRRCGNHDGRGNCPANCQHCQTTSGTVLDQGTNLKPVPEQRNQPSHQAEMHNNSSAPMQQPKVEQAPQPMAFFPEIEDAPESSTKLISFPDLDTASDIDADE
jgi:hypothetical protein